MSARTHLVPTPITDKTGRNTTVYRRPARGVGQGAATLPAPAAPVSPLRLGADEQYEERQAAIKEANARWRAGDRSGADSLKDPALMTMANLMHDMIDAKDKAEARSLAEDLSATLGEGRYANVLIAHHFAPAFRDFSLMPREEEFPVSDEDMDKALTREDYGPSDISEVLYVVRTLQRFDLRTYTAGPEEDAERLASHLCAQSNRTPDYAGFPESVEGVVRLIDEHPERVKEIVAAHGSGMHAPAIAALFNGETPGLVSGAL